MNKSVVSEHILFQHRSIYLFVDKDNIVITSFTVFIKGTFIMLLLANMHSNKK